MPICGLCKESRSVQHIRWHYANKTPSPSQATWRGNTSEPALPATDKQLDYIRDMQRALNVPAIGTRDRKEVDTLSRSAASEIIAQLEPAFKALAARPVNSDLHPDRAPGRADPRTLKATQPQDRPAMPDVPDGYYATRTADGTVHFWRVSHRNAYMVIQAQASDTLHPVRSYTRRVGIAKQILSDISGARALYVEKLERCYVCGRTLTDAESRADGRGPVCRARDAA